jgi:hypothetical protein
MTAPCDLTITGSGVEIEPRGIHRWGSLSRGFTVPLSAIADVQVRPAWVLESWKSYSLTKFKVGSWIPGVYRAGKFHMWNQDRETGTTWWLVRHPERAIELTLRDFKYDRIIVEVDDPEGTSTRLLGAIDGRKVA